MARILLIDDDDDVRATLRDLLETEDHTVVEARNGETAAALLDAHPFELVITDIVLGRSSGFDTIARLKRLAPDKKVIAISGSAGREDVLGRALEMGADRVLAKPVSMAELADAVNGCLSARPTHSPSSTSRTLRNRSSRA